MILNKIGDTLTVDGKTFAIGGRVYSHWDSDFGGLFGTVTEIRTGTDKDTDNEGEDIYVCFDVPENKAVIEKLEERFTSLYGEPKTIDEIGLDMVIMAPEELDAIDFSFTSITLQEFNEKYGLSAGKDMDITEFTDYIEDNGISYFYASYNEKDVVRAVENEWEVAEHLNIDYLCVDGLYLAAY